MTNTVDVMHWRGDQFAVMQAAEVFEDVFGPEGAVVTTHEVDNVSFDLSIYLPSSAERTRYAALLGEAVGEAAAGSLSFEKLEQRDWVAQSLAGLTPVRAGRFLVHGSHHRSELPTTGVAVEIEAALAFGTGHHGTTRGCLTMLDALLKRGHPRRVLDLGAGTGVLAIAAAKALHRRVVASDIDPVAVRVARANARLNRAGPIVTVAAARGVLSSTVRAGAPYDLVFANILLGPLKQLAVAIRAVTTPGAAIVLSGLLPRHAAAALGAYRLQGFYLIRRIDLDGWTTLLVRRGLHASVVSG